MAPDRYLLVLMYLVGTCMVGYPVPCRTSTVMLLVPYRTVSYGTEVPRTRGLSGLTVFFVILGVLFIFTVRYGIGTVPYLTHLIIVSFRTFLPFSMFTSPFEGYQLC